jgi:transposase
MSAYSLDLREKSVESVKKGVAKAETARRFGVDRATVKRYCKQLDERGTLEPRIAPGKRPKLDERPTKLLLQDLEGRSWATHAQRAQFLFAVSGARVSDGLPNATTHLAHPKKRCRGAAQRDEFLRSLWRMELGRIDAERLLFVGEMGTHTSLAPLYAYAPIGERAFFEIPRNRGKNTTLLTSLHQGGMGHRWLRKGRPIPECSKRT